MEVVQPGGTLLTVTERGYGKRTEIDEYRLQSRGGMGIINITTTERNGRVVGVAYVQDGDELMLITQQGMILRMATDDVRAIGRATQGVRLIDIEGDDKVVSIARLVDKEEEEAATPSRDRVARGSCRVGDGMIASIVTVLPRSLLVMLVGAAARRRRAVARSRSSSPPPACATTPRSATSPRSIFEPTDQRHRRRASRSPRSHAETTTSKTVPISAPVKAARRCGRSTKRFAVSLPKRADRPRPASGSCPAASGRDLLRLRGRNHPLAVAPGEARRSRRASRRSCWPRRVCRGSSAPRP